MFLGGRIKLVFCLFCEGNVVSLVRKRRMAGGFRGLFFWSWGWGDGVAWVGENTLRGERELCCVLVVLNFSSFLLEY